MYTRPLLNELKLSDNSRLRLLWNDTDRTLSVQLWRPMSGRDGHGVMYTSQVVLQGSDLQAFVTAIAALQEPELLPAA